MRSSRLLASVRKGWTISLVMVREAIFRSSRERQVFRTGKQLARGVFMYNGFMNVMGFLLISALAMYPFSIPVADRIYGFQLSTLGAVLLVITMNFMNTFYGSWLLQNFGYLDVLKPLPVEDGELQVALIIATSLTSLWIIFAGPVLAIGAYASMNDVVLSVYSLVTVYVGALIGAALGYLVASMVGGRRYVTPSYRTALMQLAQTLLVLFTLTAYYIVLSIFPLVIRTVREFAVSLRGSILHTLLYAIYPINIAFTGGDTLLETVQLAVQLLWLMGSWLFYRYGALRFCRSALNPKHRMIMHPVKPLTRSVIYRVPASMAVAFKDLKMVFRDARYSSTLLLPLVMLIPAFINWYGRARAQLMILANYLAMVEVSTLALSLQSMQVEGRYGWLSLYHLGSRRKLAKGKLVLSTLTAVAYILPVSLILIFSMDIAAALISVSCIPASMGASAILISTLVKGLKPDQPIAYRGGYIAMAAIPMLHSSLSFAIYSSGQALLGILLGWALAIALAILGWVCIDKVPEIP